MSDRQIPGLCLAQNVNPRARLGRGTSVWHLAQIREGAEIGPAASSAAVRT